MQVVFSNPLMYVIDYPTQGAIEIFDRRSGCAGLMMGDVADEFRHQCLYLADCEAGLDAFEDFIDHYRAFLTQPVVQH